MRLVNIKTGKEVKKDDIAYLSDGTSVKVVYLMPPHKSSSSGKVVVIDNNFERIFYPSVIGCEYIDKRTCFFTYTETHVFSLSVDITEKEEKELKEDSQMALQIWERHHAKDYDKYDDLMIEKEVISDVQIELEDI